MMSYLNSLSHIQNQNQIQSYKLDLINVRISGLKILSVPQWYDADSGKMNYYMATESESYLITYKLCESTSDNGLYVCKLSKGHLLNIYYSYDADVNSANNEIATFDFSKIGENLSDCQKVTNVNDKYFIVGSFIFELIANM